MEEDIIISRRLEVLYDAPLNKVEKTSEKVKGNSSVDENISTIQPWTTAWEEYFFMDGSVKLH